MKEKVMNKILNASAIIIALSVTTPAFAWHTTTYVIDNETSFGDPMHATLVSMTMTDIVSKPPTVLTFGLNLDFGMKTTITIPESGSCMRDVAIYVFNKHVQAPQFQYTTIYGDAKHSPGQFNACTMSGITVSGGPTGKYVITYH